MQGEVIGAGEAALADLAAEGFSARVFPIVAGELIGSGETPLTLGPMAAVRFLTCQRQPNHTKKEKNRREKVIICIKVKKKKKGLVELSMSTPVSVTVVIPFLC